MKRIGEQDLIAYHLGELPWWKTRLLRHRLGSDAELASESEEIAATLRAFSSVATHEPSQAVWERSWNRVRTSLGVLDVPSRRSLRLWVAASAGVVAVVVVAAIIAIPRMHMMQATNANNAGPPPLNWSQRLQAELSQYKASIEPFNNRPGPLTTAPVDAVADDPALSTHLDVAERVLTEVSHTDGPLQPVTREQIHRLLLENAVYRQSAEQHGDMGAAAVIDDLGRVLTSLDAEPLNDESEAPHAEKPQGVRLEMNVGGVLLDLRILHYSDRSNKDQ